MPLLRKGGGGGGKVFQDGAVVCVIELNDKSHNAKIWQDGGTFLEKACISAGMPLIQFRAKARYNINDVKNRLSGYDSLAKSEPDC